MMRVTLNEIPRARKTAGFCSCLAGALIGLWTVSARATDGTWINPTQGEWNDAANWQDGQIAAGENSTASITYGAASPRLVHIPAAGVTVGKITVTGTRAGYPTLWGGPITLQGTDKSIVGADYGANLTLANPIRWTGELQLARVQVFGPMDCAEDAYVPNGCNIITRFLFGAQAAETVPSNFLPTGRVTFKGESSVTLTPRSPSAARTASFTLTKDSTLAVSSEVAQELAPGCSLTGEGVAEGTFVKTGFGDNHFELSQPATASGTFVLNMSAMVGGGTQRFEEVRTENGTASFSFENRNAGGVGTAYPTLTIDRYTSLSSGTLAVNGWGGACSIGIGEDCAGGLAMANTIPVEIVPLTDKARMGRLSPSGVAPNVTIPSGTLTVDRLDGTEALTKNGSGRLVVAVPYGGTASAVLANAGALAVTGDRTARADLPAGVTFHVDATKLASMDLISEGGTNFVDRWSDASGGSMFAAFNDHGQYNGHQRNRRPFLRAEAQSGLPVVDFGSPKSTITWRWIEGFGGSLDWSAAIESVREVFMIVADVRGGSNSYMGYLTNTSDGGQNYAFLRGDNGDICNQEVPSAAIDNVRNGLVQVDGETVASSTAMPNGFHLVHFRTLGGVRADSFCSDRSYAEGGLQIGEAIIYERVLTDDESDSVTNYLRAKWFGAEETPVRTIAAVTTSSDGAELTAEDGQTLVVTSLTMNGPVTKKGAGKLRIGTLVNANNHPLTVEGGSVEVSDGETLALRTLNAGEDGAIAKEGAGTLVATVLGGDLDAVDVRGGTLRLATGEKPAGAFFHIDASAASTYDTFAVGDRAYVSKVRDASGGTVTAEPKQTKSAGSPIANPSPYIDTAYLEGKPVFNFGSMWTSANPSGEGGNLCWSSKASDFRECFLVYADHPSCVAAGVGQFILGGHTVGDDNIHPFWRNGLDLLYQGDAWSAMGCSVFYGLKQVDGIDRAYNYSLPGGFHILRFKTTRDATKSPEKGLADVMVNAFACEREYNMGGQLIAEALIFDGADLSDEAAQKAYDYLYAKWFKPGASTAYELNSLSVRQGATFDLGSLEVKAVSVRGGGTVATPRLTVAEDAVWTVPLAGEPLASAAMTVNGVLALSSSGTVNLAATDDATPIPCGVYPLVTATGYEGLDNLAQWTVTASGNLLARRKATVRSVGGQIVVSVEKNGLILIFR